MKKSVTFILLLAAICTIDISYAANPKIAEPPLAVDQHLKHQKHHKPNKSDRPGRPDKPDKKHRPHHKKRPAPPIGAHYREKPAHCIEIMFNHSPYFYAGGIFYRPERTGYVVVRPEIGMVVPLLPTSGVYKIKKKGETLYVFDDVLYKPLPDPKGIKFKIVGFLPIP